MRRNRPGGRLIASRARGYLQSRFRPGTDCPWAARGLLARAIGWKFADGRSRGKSCGAEVVGGKVRRDEGRGARFGSWFVATGLIGSAGGGVCRLAVPGDRIVRGGRNGACGGLTVRGMLRDRGVGWSSDAPFDVAASGSNSEWIK